MKFRKTMLAALAMSALMATSAMPAFAAEAETEAGVGVKETWTISKADIKFYSDLSVEYWATSSVTGQKEKKEATATLVKTNAATCVDAPSIEVKATLIDGKVYESQPIVTGEALGHKYEFKDENIVQVVTVEPADCKNDGTATVYYKCLNGCDVKKEVKDYVLDATGHKPSEDYEVSYVKINNIKLDDDGEVVLGTDGLPQLDELNKDGSYLVRKTYTCQNKNCPVETFDVDSDPVIIYAQEVAYSVISDVKGLANADLTYDEWKEIECDVYELELTKCTVAGSFKVTDYSADDKAMASYTVTVPAHHMELPVVAEFKAQKDLDQCTVTVDEETGNQVVVNDSCYLDVTYDAVVHCAAKGCTELKCNSAKVYTQGNVTHGPVVSRTEITLEPAGDCVINKTVKDAIAAEAEKNAHAYVTYDFLKSYADGENAAITLTDLTATCEESGTVTVNYLCKVCREKVTSEVVKVKALGHKAKASAYVENKVEPTCEARGSQDTVIYCEYCDKELERRTVSIPRLPHTNEVSVDVDDRRADKTVQVKFDGDLVVDERGWLMGDSADSWYETLSKLRDAEFYVKAFAYTYCENGCGHEVKVGKATIEVVDVKKQDKECLPGSITLKATYTITNAEDEDLNGTKVTAERKFDYYSSMEAFSAQVAHAAGEKQIENVVPATATTAGSYDEVYYCRVCGTEISRKTVTVDATGNIILPAVTGLKATATGMNKVTVSWDAVEGADGYLVLKDGVQIAYTTGATSYVDRNADSENFEYYWVIAYHKNDGKNVKGELSNYVWAIGRVVGKAANLVAVAGEEGVKLTWDEVAGANGYVVLSKTGSNTAEFNAPIKATDNTCIDTAAEGVTFYWVYATYANEAGVVAAGAVSPFAWAVAK